MNILITSAGKRVSLLRAFKKELGADGKVFAADSNPMLSAACAVADNYFKLPKATEKDFFKTKLLETCLANNISLIIPTIDIELKLLASLKDEFRAKGITVVVCSEEFIDKCRDKRAIHEFFSANNIAIAKEFTKNNFTLPLFIKPVDGSRSVDTYIIETKEDLTDYHFKNPKLMFLEYLDHKLYEEFTCDLYYGKDHFLKCIVPRKRIEIRDGEVNKGVTRKNKLIPYIQERLDYIDGAIGCLTAQFFKHKKKNTIYGIEINPRFGGGFPLSYIAGANYPQWIIQEYMKDNEVTQSFDCWEPNLLMMRYDDEIVVHGYRN